MTLEKALTYAMNLIKNPKELMRIKAIIEQGEVVHDKECGFWRNEYCDCEAIVK